MNRRDLLLNEMGFRQWQLVKPQVLKGSSQIPLPSQVRLVVVCEEDQQKSPFFQDVLRAVSLNNTHYQWLDSEQFQRLAVDHPAFFWFILPKMQADQLAEKYQASSAKKSAFFTAFQQESWAELAQPASKRQLWQALQHAVLFEKQEENLA